MREGLTTVSVRIGGEEYSIRTEATPEHARECAALVDTALTDIRARGPMIEAHKAGILAALSIADLLLQERHALQSERSESARRADSLAADVESALARDLASQS